MKKYLLCSPTANILKGYREGQVDASVSGDDRTRAHKYPSLSSGYGILIGRSLVPFDGFNTPQ